MINKDIRIMIRLDKKLFNQLRRYADRNDEGIVSVSARRAIRQFLEEAKKQKNN